MARERFEVILVNDGVTHDLSPLAESFRREGLGVRVLNVPQGGPAKARNLGAAAASGELLVFTDDDCLPEPLWLSSMYAASQQHPLALLGGSVVNVLTHRSASEASQVLVSFLYEWYNRDPHDARFFTSNNIAARKQVFESHGGFDTRFVLSAGEDRDLCARWREQGGRLVYVPDARIGHAHDLTVRKFWRQHFKYGRGAAMYWSARPSPQGTIESATSAAGAPRTITVEPLSFYAGLLAYPFGATRWSLALPVAALVLLSQIANALGYFSAARRWPRIL